MKLNIFLIYLYLMMVKMHFSVKSHLKSLIWTNDCGLKSRDGHCFFEQNSFFAKKGDVQKKTNDGQTK